MARDAGHHPAAAGQPAAPLQPAEGTLLDWIDEPEHLARAEHLDRLAADLDLVNTLALRRFEGPAWETFETELARYGLGVIRSWIRRGVIFQRCREKGYGGLPDYGRPIDNVNGDVDELADLTVAIALDRFRSDVLLKGTWDHRRGATLRTYFIGQCLIRFPNVYRQWFTRQERWRPEIPANSSDDMAWLWPATGPDEHQIIDRMLIDQVLSKINDPRVRQAFIMIANGHTQNEIAHTLNVTVKTVERMIANQRARMRRAG